MLFILLLAIGISVPASVIIGGVYVAASEETNMFWPITGYGFLFCFVTIMFIGSARIVYTREQHSVITKTITITTHDTVRVPCAEATDWTR